ncbi:alpha/beta hydrolase family protein [endosymbiont GvMRE of Glomus versiforme]|uniref:alpha/beta hydrolase family protein n=1 Tax=endosymbiont GvMRE of Glomus versiforme TaxID=2039283 RepID=UPI000EE64044|nr:alpha/beta fold hydrolase [endosymbiont GvMRE of Glomus versiforme]RHZ35412.1 Alpha/beta hydrolase family protein [endosymbiont GvMRE of Glomus versiforme]
MQSKMSKLWLWAKKLYKNILRLFFLSPNSSRNLDIINDQDFIDLVNNKIKLLTWTRKNSINVTSYQRYFNFLKELELTEEFSIITTRGNLVIKGVSLHPILKNSNNKKVIIFCHGVTNNKWSLFYIIHLVLQRGYQVINYDARNHGSSENSINTLGQEESCDLQDIIGYVKKTYQPEKICLYGFSMGAATCLFWISYFSGGNNSEVKLVVSESSFEDFSGTYEYILGKGINYYWKKILVDKLIENKLKSTKQALKEISPFINMPWRLPVKLLLLHGLEDSIVEWKCSLNFYHRLKRTNKKKINLYLFKHADHGEVSFIGDHVPDSIRWRTSKKESQKYSTFTELLYNYLQKNL